MGTLANKIVGSVDNFINKLIAEKPFVEPTHEIKVNTLKEYAKKYSLDTFIETGTFLGDTVYALRNNFKKIISVELSSDLCNKARRRFANDKHISILQGDSGALMGSILDSLKEPALFWLDGHYSGGITARGELDTPIIKELGLILNHHIKNHVILIDDARCFVGENDYPTIKELLAFVSKLNNNLNVKVEDDIIRIYPGKKDVSYSEPWRHKTERKIFCQKIFRL